MSAFIRALSPAVGAITATNIALAGLGDDATASAAQKARLFAIMGVNSVHELIELIPSDYRAVLTDPLNRLVQLVHKLDSSKTTLAKWSEHERAGTLPPQLRGKPQKLQLTTEFAGTAQAAEAKSNLETAHKAYQAAVLTSWIKAKTDEVAVLVTETSAQTAWSALRRIVAAHGPSILERNKLPVIVQDGHGADAVGSWEISAAAQAIHDHVMEDCIAYASRVITITENGLRVKALKFEKKKKLATAARTAAGDMEIDEGHNGPTSAIASSSSSSIRTLVAKELRTLLKEQAPVTQPNKRKRNAGASGSNTDNAEKRRKMAAAKVRNPPASRAPDTEFPLDSLRSNDRSTQRRTPAVRPSSLSLASSSKLNQKQARPSTQFTRRSHESWAGSAGSRSGYKGARGAQGQGSAGGSRHVGTWENAHMDAKTVHTSLYTNAGSSGRANAPPLDHSTIKNHVLPDPDSKLFICEGDLWISNPALIPDYLLDLPVPEAIDVILGRMSLEMISLLSYQQDVHQSPGVNLPQGISYQISVGAKYMFHEPTNVDLIRKSWVDFNRRLRWRLHFLLGNEGEKPYDSDYDVRAPSTKQAPALPQYIELGLVKGRLFAYEAIAKVPDAETLRHPHKTLQPDVGLVREFLLSNDYVITGTDKNLGIAVSRRDWIVEKSQDILNDVNNYRRLEHDEAIHILNEKCVEMESLAALAHDHVDYLEGTVADFLRSKITLRGEAHHIPKFYGIPKIHKTPVKMRPIIPCHSAIQNPAAKYCSKKLKPLIQAAASVIHGSKDLAYKLSSLSIDTSRKWYIMTGDVVAYYPNIPLQHCLDIVYNMYYEFYWNIPNHDHALNQAKQNLFKRCLEVGNTRLMTQFQNQIYEQLNGLAMGVADSPDLANLYGYYFEERSGVLNHNDVAFYGRYIDDCIAVVYAESEDHASLLLSNLIKFDNCTITWDCSGSHAPFLDMLLYKDADNTLQHMPYRKNGNHQERLPWISAHPYDVKRGTFLGEMSRLATLSSKLEHYLAAMRGLVALYIRRGYPVDEVHKWLYANLSKRWDNRLAERPAQDANVLVLKTQYNLAWNYFNAHQLGDTIFGYWREWLRRSDTGDFNSEYPAPGKGKEESSHGLDTELPDLRETNIFNSKVILSRKRTRNFLDLSNLWKKSVLEKLDEQTIDNLLTNAAQRFALKRPFIPDINAIAGGSRLKRSREDPNQTQQIHRSRSSSPVPSSWRSGALTTWGRGRG
jgi:hypothetical protein